MKRIYLLFIALAIISCKEKQKETLSEVPQEDNAELIEIYKNDQSDRSGTIDWSVVSVRDRAREARVYELLDSNKVQTGKDYYNAAMVFQHGADSTAYGMAVKMIKKSIELDSTTNKWLFAAATDRYLLSKNEPQIYGTQYKRNGKDTPWKLGEIDTTKITDAQRIEYRVETLAEQREKVKTMNRRKLSELVKEGKSIDEIIDFVNSEDKKNPSFDISERGVNMFGYAILGEGKKEDALKIFKLNTELYPESFNTFDSYGECLLLLGNKVEGLKAYKKSLELNPKNRNAETILEEHK